MNPKKIALVVALSPLPSAPVLAQENMQSAPAQNAPLTREETMQAIQGELQRLKEVNVQLYRRIQYLEGQVQRLTPTEPQAEQQTPQKTEERVARRQEHTTNGEQNIKKSPGASRAIEDAVLEEHTLFDQTFSLELGMEYSHFDRSQLVLNGFLALDAIFLGDISIDEVDADIWTTSLTARWGLTDRLQLNLRVPWVYRETTFSSGGQDLSSVLVSEETVDDSDIGDVSLGMSYQLLRETPSFPDVVWNLSVQVPTGRDPYGIKYNLEENFTQAGTNTNIELPEALPTGSGLWGITTGLSFLRTIDPGVLFASLSYSHYLEESFSDISGEPEVIQPGEVQLGDRYRFSAGLAFALNERSNMSFAFTQEFFDSAEVTREGQPTREIVGSDTSAGTFDVGITYAMTHRFSVIGNLGVGLTQDTSDYTFSLRFPYRF